MRSTVQHTHGYKEVYVLLISTKMCLEFYKLFEFVTHFSSSCERGNVAINYNQSKHIFFMKIPTN